MVCNQDTSHRPVTCHVEGLLNTSSAKPAKKGDVETKYKQDKRTTGSSRQGCSCPITWSEHAFRSTGMGDVCSPVTLLLAIGKAADIFSPGDDNLSRTAREQLQLRSYYDDIMCAAPTAEERDKLINRMDYIIKRAGMKLHEWFRIGPDLKFPPPPSPATSLDPMEAGYSHCVDCLGTEAEGIFIKVLGMMLCRRCDNWSCSVSVNLSKKKRNLYQGPPLRRGMDVRK